MWTSTGQLGDVQAGQQAGYLFPMGPFFAARARARPVGLGGAAAVARHRAGARRLGGGAAARRAAAARPAALAQLVAGAVTLLQPVRRHLRQPHHGDPPRLRGAAVADARRPSGPAGRRGAGAGRPPWRCSSPPRAAASTAPSPRGCCSDRCCCCSTSWLLTEVGWGEIRAFLARAIPLTALVSLWWVMPAYVQSAYGINFLHFTEQPGTVWGTTSVTESLRLMSFWLSYVGHRLRRPRDPVLRRLPDAAVLRPGGARLAAAAGARPGRLRVDPPLALRAVLPGSGAGGGADHGGRLPRGHAAAPRAAPSPTTTSPRCVPARLLQGGTAAGAGPGRAWPGPRRRGAVARVSSAAGTRAAWWRRRGGGGAAPRCWRWRRGRWSPGAPRTRRCPTARFRPPGARRRAVWTTNCPPTRGRSCCPATCSRSTAGAAPSIRSCRR